MELEMQRQIQIKDSYLELIRDIGYDYDAAATREELKNIITELVEYAQKALNNDDYSIIYNNNMNILFEEM